MQQINAIKRPMSWRSASAKLLREMTSLVKQMTSLMTSLGDVAHQQNFCEMTSWALGAVAWVLYMMQPEGKARREI